MENMKFRIDTPAQSEALQNVLFTIGYGWRFGGYDIQHTDGKFLYAGDDGIITFDADAAYFNRYEYKEQNTKEFIAKHIKANEMKNPAGLEFDINADISRQYTRDGRKIVFLQDTGLDITYPISAAIEDDNQTCSFTKLGHYYEDEEGVKNESRYDIITRPEVKPLITGYFNVYSEEIGVKHNSYSRAIDYSSASDDFLNIIKLTYNPNDGSVAAEIVKE